MRPTRLYCRARGRALRHRRRTSLPNSLPSAPASCRICELKGIRSDSTHTNYNGAEVTGVAKRELTIPVEVVRQAIKLDERVFGVVAPAVGPWQRRLLELGGVRPLAFGQYGEWGAGFEELVRAALLRGACCGGPFSATRAVYGTQQTHVPRASEERKTRRCALWRQAELSCSGC